MKAKEYAKEFIEKCGNLLLLNNIQAKGKNK